MMEGAATEKKSIDWLGAFAFSSPESGGDLCFVSAPPAARKGKSIDWLDAFARSSPEPGGDVCLVSAHPAARKGNRSARSSFVHGEGTSIDWMDVLRPSAERAGDFCFNSPPSAAAKGKGRRVAKAEEWEFSGIPARRELALRSDGALRREIADLRSTLRRIQPRLAALEGEARRRRRQVSVAHSPPRDVEAEFSRMSNEALRRDIAEMSDGELRREIVGLRSNNTHLQFQPRLGERRTRLLPLLEAEARRHQGSTRSRTQDGDDRKRGARTSTAQAKLVVPTLHYW